MYNAWDETSAQIPIKFLRNAILSVWSVWLVAVLSGAKSNSVARIAFLLSVFLFILNWSRRHDLGVAVVQTLERWVTAKRVLLGISFVIIVQIAALFADQWALEGTLWDLTLYIQLIEAKAKTGHPWATFSGTVLDYHSNHLSLSLPFLGFLAKWIPAAWLSHIWMGFTLFAPAYVFWLWARTLDVRNQTAGTGQSGVLYLAAAGLWVFSPAVLKMETWPYVLSSAGFFLMAASYYFYFQDSWHKWWGWAACLVLACLEKEDYGLFGATFGLMVFLQHAVKPKKEAVLPIALSIIVISVSIGAIGYIHATGRGTVSTFASRFGSFGATPQEAVQNFFIHPEIIVRMLSRPLVFKYLFFFLAMSCFWLVPGPQRLKKWARIFWIYLPGLPILVANVMSENVAMYQLKDPYALPVAVAMGAAMVFGTFQVGWGSKKITEWSRFCLLAMAVGFLLWDQQFPMRTLKKRLEMASDRTPARNAMQWIKNDPSLIVCCKERLCSWFAERDNIFILDVCLAHPERIEALLGQRAFEKKVFVAYASDRNLPPELKWRYQDELLKISEPVAIR